eukprot:TRINITY_DN16494_c0_g2_i1.p1 TRINITY_DN16494_c0_g2~~TRINITY_DN16494_c0_g2_i1.p1  ORF type:complete len:318 (+),score=141.88 TRINITY_DN16494_c0_g2_i1:97-954(+)
MTLDGTNTYLIGTGKRRILLDTGEGGKKEYVANLHRAMRERGCVGIEHVLLTHRHHDHIGGVADVLAMCAELQDEPPTVWKLLTAEDDGDEKEAFATIEDGQEFTTQGATLRAVFTPGHTDDHVCFVLREESAVFSGDCILGAGTAVFRDLGQYMRSLRRLQELSPKRIYPAHGPLIEDGMERITTYIDHRMVRERQIVDTLKEIGGKDGGATSMALVKRIYKDVDPALHVAANMNVLLHLGKLLQDGVAVASVQGSAVRDAHQLLELLGGEHPVLWSLKTSNKL